MPMVLVYLLVLIILGLALRIFFNQVQGKAGEWKIQKYLSQLNRAHYRVLNDLLLPSRGFTNTTQLDHLVVSSYGIFVIETKSQRGKIIGNAKDQYWTEYFYRRKHRVYNPLRQNYAHVMAIKDIVKIKYPHLPVFGLVVFPLCEKLSVSGTDEVITAPFLLPAIKAHNSETLNPVQIEEIINLIKGTVVSTRFARQKHILNIKLRRFFGQ